MRADWRLFALRDAIFAPHRSADFDGPKVSPFWPYLPPQEILDDHACIDRMREERRKEREAAIARDAAGQAAANASTPETGHE